MAATQSSINLHDPFAHAVLKLGPVVLHGTAVLVFFVVVAVLVVWEVAVRRSRAGRNSRPGARRVRSRAKARARR
jgi:branched-subunit amino acid ABC-type transport system permease component